VNVWNVPFTAGHFVEMVYAIIYLIAKKVLINVLFIFPPIISIYSFVFEIFCVYPFG